MRVWRRMTIFARRAFGIPLSRTAAEAHGRRATHPRAVRTLPLPQELTREIARRRRKKTQHPAVRALDREGAELVEDDLPVHREEALNLRHGAADERPRRRVLLGQALLNLLQVDAGGAGLVGEHREDRDGDAGALEDRVVPAEEPGCVSQRGQQRGRGDGRRKAEARTEAGAEKAQRTTARRWPPAA